ncbi:hypothetical protein [Salinisphaera hydrothermalis]|uniref:Cytochrome C oxidase assembly protein n=1 Tax=Salinisphaera hydrothermalis (strain C41B8) TaxID=1304275 RepID=A0A084IKU8_SALHC|nr:hypothetical protein [Salinisphaera hydrothermalis]KEZ77332.1 hypothetical protein C41B8_10740 [Salinisphaera hydrothermalis C41B8]
MAFEHANSAPHSDDPAADPHHVVEGELTWLVRAVGLAIGAALTFGVLLGLYQGLTHTGGLREQIAHGLLVAQIVFAAVLIMLGSIVEGFGFGLALGTRWPYTKNIVILTLRGDPEAAHRVVATLVGLVGVALAIANPVYEMFLGLGLIVTTALFGMGVLYVLAGRAPAIVHGTHGLLAYLVFLAYLVPLAHADIGLGLYLKIIVPTHALLFAIFMGGIVTGSRGFGQPIEQFAMPKRKSQWIFALHGLAGLMVLGTLGWYMPTYPVAFALVLVQIAIGFILFQSVNLKPKAPGAVVAFHQAMALLITSAIVMQWHF